MSARRRLPPPPAPHCASTAAWFDRLTRVCARGRIYLLRLRIYLRRLYCHAQGGGRWWLAGFPQEPAHANALRLDRRRRDRCGGARACTELARSLDRDLRGLLHEEQREG